MKRFLVKLLSFVFKILFHSYPNHFICFKIIRPVLKNIRFSCFVHSQWNKTGAVFIQPPKSNFIHCVCSDSCSSWDKFDEYFSFSNKAQCVPKKNSTKFVDWGFNAQIIGVHVGYIEYSGGRTCGHAEPKYNMAFSEHIASNVCLFSPVHTIQHSGWVWSAGYVLGQPLYVTTLAGRAVNDLLFKLC